VNNIADLGSAITQTGFSGDGYVLQRTLKASIGCAGVGLHSGQKIRITLHPAPADHGIVFRRTDLDDQPLFPARYDSVIDTRLCTCLGDTSPGHQDRDHRTSDGRPCRYAH